uniref:Uncharacterized protein n=1 Tax=Oryza punctata TaxID=4537 RepID=A0A0E0M6A5_ORYPU
MTKHLKETSYKYYQNSLTLEALQRIVSGNDTLVVHQVQKGIVNIVCDGESFSINHLYSRIEGEVVMIKEQKLLAASKLVSVSCTNGSICGKAARGL